MSKSIISVGFEIPGAGVEYSSFNTELSLLDYDIALINPDISYMYQYPSQYRGKPCLDDSDSFQLKERLKHWRREIVESMKVGKTVFLMLGQLEEVYVATGEKTFSGSGRNRVTTRHVEFLTNYALIPSGVEVVNAKGKRMLLCGPDNILDAYWTEMKTLSEYRVFVNGDAVYPLLKTRTGEKTVGGYLRYDGISGCLILLPFVDFDREEFTEYREDEETTYWTKHATRAGAQFLSAIVGIDKTVRGTADVSPIPQWVELDDYVLPKEEVARGDLLRLEEKLKSIQKAREKSLQLLSKEAGPKRLLYEKGKSLEIAVRDALKIIGFSVSRFDDGKSEFDAVFECAEGRFIGEAEGKDNKPINIEKLRQLEMNIHEDFEREDVEEMAKGVLIGNAQRLVKPDERGEFFTEKCLQAAERSKTALVRSIDLFDIVKYLTNDTDDDYARKCREAILTSVGIVSFPLIPETTQESKKNGK